MKNSNKFFKEFSIFTALKIAICSLTSFRNTLQVAFVGRSNVGKSSLIRAVLGQVDVDVRVSSKPVSSFLIDIFYSIFIFHLKMIAVAS